MNEQQDALHRLEQTGGAAGAMSGLVLTTAHQSAPCWACVFVAETHVRPGRMLDYLRPDELHTAFNFKGGWIHVNRQVRLVGTKPVFALPKGNKIRSVPLPTQLAAALKAI
jgi:hypothetical protein